MSNVTFGSKVSQKSSVAKGKRKVINYIRHEDGSLSLNGMKLSPAIQARVEKQLKAQAQSQ